LNGIETVVSTDERPLTDAERFEVEDKQRLSKWYKRMERLAAAAAALSALLGIVTGNKSLRNICDILATALAVVALGFRGVAKRQE
jgi:hypothetical protein